MSSDLKSNNYQFKFKMDKPHSQKIYEFEDFRLNAAHLLLYENGREISLTPKVVQTLLALVERSGELLSKDELMNIIWADSFVEEGNLTQNLYLLRKVLHKKTNGKPLIETLKRRGYRFIGNVVVVEPETAEISSSNKPSENEIADNNKFLSDGREITDSESQSVKPANAFEACQLARMYFQQSTLPTYIKARELLEEAIRLDANYAPAYIALAELCLKEAIYNLSGLDEGFANAKKRARKSR